MACDSPVFVSIRGRLTDIQVGCGKCPPCKLRRVNSWVFRLQQEDKISTSAFFITLTYDGNHVPISNNGFMTLNKRDFQLFMKRLRKLSLNKLKYYLAGEYGTHNYRPHYHLILFNLEDVQRLPDGSYRSKYLDEAWTFGVIHIGSVTSDSIAYTTKYIDKPTRIPMHQRDDRLKEFSLMSKGLGANYLSDAIVDYHKADLTRNFITQEGGHKIALPTYYRNRIFNDEEKLSSRRIIVKSIHDDYDASAVAFIRSHPDDDYELYLRNAKTARHERFYSKLNKSRNL